jgi:hypothetical protein
VTLEIPYEEYDRLKGQGRERGHHAPVSDIGMIFLNDIDVMLDPNVRKPAPRDRQADDRRPAAVGLRRAHRHAADPGIRRL